MKECVPNLALGKIVEVSEHAKTRWKQRFPDKGRVGEAIKESILYGGQRGNSILLLNVAYGAVFPLDTSTNEVKTVLTKDQAIANMQDNGIGRYLDFDSETTFVNDSPIPPISELTKDIDKKKSIVDDILLKIKNLNIESDDSIEFVWKLINGSAITIKWLKNEADYEPAKHVSKFIDIINSIRASKRKFREVLKQL